MSTKFRLSVTLSDKDAMARQRQGSDGKLIEGLDSLASWKGNLLEECEECRDDCLTRDALQLINGAHCRSLSVEADRKH